MKKPFLATLLMIFIHQAQGASKVIIHGETKTPYVEVLNDMGNLINFKYCQSRQACRDMGPKPWYVGAHFKKLKGQMSSWGKVLKLGIPVDKLLRRFDKSYDPRNPVFPTNHVGDEVVRVKDLKKTSTNLEELLYRI